MSRDPLEIHMLMRIESNILSVQGVESEYMLLEFTIFRQIGELIFQRKRFVRKLKPRLFGGLSKRGFFQSLARIDSARDRLPEPTAFGLQLEQQNFGTWFTINPNLDLQLRLGALFRGRIRG